MRLQHQNFAEEYLIHFDATKAYINSGYSAKTAKNNAYRVLYRDDVQEYLAMRMKTLKMSADEVLLRLGRQARGEEPTKITKAYGELKEEYDTNKALAQLAKTMAMFVDRQQIEIEGIKIIDD